MWDGVLLFSLMTHVSFAIVAGLHVLFEHSFL